MRLITNSQISFTKFEVYYEINCHKSTLHTNNTQFITFALETWDEV